MDLKRRALIVELLQEMNEKGSWSGETHVQKCVYVGQELFGLPMDFEFILYKHGPFSFELRDELARMQADGVIRVFTQPEPYGSTLAPGSLAGSVVEQFPKTLRKFHDRIRFVANALGTRGVAELERIATALFVTREQEGQSDIDRAKRLVALKPHINFDEALEAVRYVDRLIVGGRGLV